MISVVVIVGVWKLMMHVVNSIPKIIWANLRIISLKHRAIIIPPHIVHIFELRLFTVAQHGHPRRDLLRLASVATIII